MASIDMIGLRPEELAWVRLLVSLLRDENPVVRELACDALVYIKTRDLGRNESAAARI